MRWGREGGLDRSTPENLRPVHSQEEAGSWLWQVKKQFCFYWSLGTRRQLIIYEEKTGNLKGLCLALEWRNKQASVSHIEGVWRRVVLCGQLLPGIRKEKEGFNHGLFVFFFPPRIISHRPWWCSVWSESRLWVWKLHRKMRSRWRTVDLAAKARC